MNILKRNGAEVPFDGQKIQNAIIKAMAEVGGGQDTTIAGDIAAKVEADITKSPEKANVESIQDLVEDYLMQSGRRDVARTYIRYR
jgi:anaerobic ribonucleoside-triphosphate reductase